MICVFPSQKYQLKPALLPQHHSHTWENPSLAVVIICSIKSRESPTGTNTTMLLSCHTMYFIVH